MASVEADSAIEQMYQCPYCEQMFRHVGSCSRHMKTHQRSNQLRCDACQRRFNRRDNLVRHQKPGGLCDRMFRNNPNAETLLARRKSRSKVPPYPKKSRLEVVDDTAQQAEQIRPVVVPASHAAASDQPDTPESPESPGSSQSPEIEPHHERRADEPPRATRGRVEEPLRRAPALPSGPDKALSFVRSHVLPSVPPGVRNGAPPPEAVPPEAEEVSMSFVRSRVLPSSPPRVSIEYGNGEIPDYSPRHDRRRPRPLFARSPSPGSSTRGGTNFEHDRTVSGDRDGDVDVDNLKKHVASLTQSVTQLQDVVRTFDKRMIAMESRMAAAEQRLAAIPLSF